MRNNLRSSLIYVTILTLMIINCVHWDNKITSKCFVGEQSGELAENP